MAAILFYTIGYPGAGKTSLAKNLAAQLGARHIYGDRIGHELFAAPRFTPDEVRLVRMTMEQQAAESLSEGVPVVYDAMLHNLAMRRRVVAIAAAQNKQAIGLWLCVPEKTARQRAGMVRVADFDKNYKRVVPKEIFDKHVEVFEPPHSSEKIIKVWGTATFPMQYASLRRQFRDRGITLV